MTAATNSPTSGPFNVQTLVDELAQRVFGKSVLQVDEALNDSDKALTVPANVNWEILSIWAELTSTATVGNRQMVVQFRDGADDVIAEVRAGAVQAASLTRNYLFAATLPDLTAFRDTDFIMNPLPRMVLPETFDVRVFDSAGIAAAADDLVLQMLVQERVEV